MSNALLKGAILSATLVATVISGCSSDDDDMTDELAGNDSVAIDGFVSMDSARPIGEAMGALQTALGGNEAITALPLIDHQVKHIHPPHSRAPMGPVINCLDITVRIQIGFSISKRAATELLN